MSIAPARLSKSLSETATSTCRDVPGYHTYQVRRIPEQENKCETSLQVAVRTSQTVKQQRGAYIEVAKIRKKRKNNVEHV